MYTILVIDYEDCCCAKIYSDGEISILFEAHSTVPHKMKVGGQSAKRFAQIRQNEITKWFKNIDNKLKQYQIDNNSIYIGMSKIYYNRFYNTLHTYNKQKIKLRVDSAYSNRCGIYDMVNSIEHGML